jgi:hypothetical protein
MPRNKSVSLEIKGKAWYIRYYDQSDVKRKKSLKTHDKKQAELYKKQLELLLLDESFHCDDFIYELYFEERREAFVTEIIKEYDTGYALIAYQKRIKELEAKISYLEPFEALCRAYEHKEQVSLMNASEECPTLSESLDLFLLSISTLNKNNIQEHKRVISLLEDKADKKVSTYTATEIEDLLREHSKDNDFPARRFNRLRIYLVRYFTWASKRYRFYNPMNVVNKLKEEQREDIEWHELDEVLKVIQSIDEPYWQRVVATLLYSGLSSHEFQGLRKRDILTIDGKNYIYVTPHTGRNLKTKNRKRHVLLSKELQKVINEQMKEPGEYLFPPTVGNRDMWHPDTFSEQLNNRLPKNMNALSLRRTFGSLLLRSGKSVEEVATAMGNTVQMVVTHYAKLLGTEVDTNFS